MECVLVFPHQLFENHPSFKKDRPIFLIQEARFFSEFAFHKQKLIFHRASLKSFEKNLKEKGYQTHYIEKDLNKVFEETPFSKVYIAELDDFELEKKIHSLVKRFKIKLVVDPTPGFLTSIKEFQSLFKGKKRLRFETFYIYQRKRLDILLEKNGKPVGGKWSTDQENRKRIPKSFKIPKPFQASQGEDLKEALSYVEKNSSKNPGSSESFNYPTNHKEAKKALRDFLKNRFIFFGDYEDAILEKEHILFHSCLSPLLNVGLLTPDIVLKEAMEHLKKHKVPLNSIEGFVRQLIGWREFIRGVYHSIGRQQKKHNFFKHKKRVPQAFYKAATGILPIDESIKKLQSHAYLHHIERLMILGNFFLLCEIDPNEIYRWFMELFIDSYDWVMVPNVYGMSQYADGGLMTTKPYFSSSNYILKMSDYRKGSWCEIWDALFWRFMIKHLQFFETQPRLSVLCQMAKKKRENKTLLNLAETFLKTLK